MGKIFPFLIKLTTGKTTEDRSSAMFFSPHSQTWEPNLIKHIHIEICPRASILGEWAQWVGTVLWEDTSTTGGFK